MPQHTSNLEHEIRVFENSLQHIEKSLQSLKTNHEHESIAEQAALKIHVAGEFSSGKTRFLTELIKHHVPDEDLLPISALSPETAIPLETTYGQIAKLELYDYEQSTPEQLYKFPQRDTFTSSKRDLNKLVLSIPEPHLRLPLNQNKIPIYLVDTPGWSSTNQSDDENRTLATTQSPAVIFVCKTIQLALKGHDAFITSIFEDLNDYAGHFEHLHLLIYVTDWEESPPNRKALADFKTRCQHIHDQDDWDATFTIHDPVPLQFNDMSPNARKAFRKEFWTTIQSIIPPADKILETAEPSTWCVRTAAQTSIDHPDLATSLHTAVAQVKTLGTFVDALFDNGQILPGMNFTRLKPYDESEWPERLKNNLKTRLNLTFSPLPKESQLPPKLPPAHLFSVWWNDIFIKQLRDAVNTVNKLVLKVNDEFDRINKPTIEDLNATLRNNLQNDYMEACEALDKIDMLFPDTVIEMITDNDASILDALTAMIGITAGRFALEAAELAPAKQKPNTKSKKKARHV